MNRINHGQSKLETSHNDDKTLLFVVNLLNSAHTETSEALALSQQFEVYEFQLGDEITTSTLPETEVSSVRSKHKVENFYLVLQGRVRLLSFDPQQQREVSVGVQSAGEFFGADELFGEISISYRAIAATTVSIARIESSQLNQWLEKLTRLEDYLRQRTQQRQRQIFFKTLTEFRRLPSHQLEELVRYTVELPILAGQSLAQATPADAGRYWLCSGQLRISDAGTDPSPTPPLRGEGLSGSPFPGREGGWGVRFSECVFNSQIGASWGYPDRTQVDAIAQTDLLLYHLPTEHCQAICDVTPSDRQKSRGARQHKSKAAAQHSQLAVDNSKPKIQNSKLSLAPNQESIAFPKPYKGIRWPWQGYPLILQQSSSDCGAACLAMIGQYWGKRFSLNYLRDLASVGRDGASLTKGLAKAAETLGFLARPVRASFQKLAEQRNPWIAHWQGIHYVVVYRCKGNHILIADPAKGKRNISRQEFLDNWSGYALLLDPTQRLKNAETQKISLGRFLGAIVPYCYLIWQIIFLSLLAQIFGVITPLFTQIILDQVVVHKSLSTLNVFILGLLLFNIWSLCIGVARQYLLDYFSNRFDLTLIGGFISHTLLLPLKFFESRRVGDIITRVQENSKIQQFLTRQVVLTWLDMVMGFVYLGLMLYYNLHLTLLVMALIPPIVILTLVATPLLQKMSREIFNEAAEQNSLLVEMLTGVATVKATAAEREIRWRWEDRFTSTLNVTFKAQKFGYILQSISSLINSFGSTALLWYGATLVIQDQLTIGQFVAFNMMIGRVLSPILAVVGIWNQMQEVLISVERLNDVFEATPEETPGKPMLILPKLRGEVRFDNVTFRYGSEGERNTLQNISFEAQPGQTIAIVGRSGSGKSTLVSMLQGFYHPDSGRVLIDGHDIRHVSPQSLRSQLGVVPQESFLFSGTILENISLYRTDFSLEEVTEAAKLAEAHAFIQDLPLGYNTKVGERGSSLSGGQRQRIAIARALLGDPRILILDEATSSLDTESERRFQQNLERLARDRTTFIIAHRLSTVRNADNILVLDRGILTEFGTHDRLMAQAGLYYHLAQQQLAI